MSADIKTMQLYPRADRILADLRAIGYGDDAPVPVEVLNRFDQLHYHGTEALDAAISATGMAEGARVLEVGSGWGGCARYLANTSRAHLTAVELQNDYHDVALDLTRRAGLEGNVRHENADFLEWDAGQGTYDCAVSWLALFHIPRRADYLAKLRDAVRPGGGLFAEDLFMISPPDTDEAEDFRRHLFPNSLVDEEEYRAGLEQGGFRIEEWSDMTSDWAAFTAERLAAFRDGRAQYEAVHGADGYATIETFYDKMAGYFERGLVGGVRLSAKRI